MTAPLTIAARVADAVAYTPLWLPVVLVALVAWVACPSRKTRAAARDIAAAADIPADDDRPAPIDARDFQPGTDWHALVACRSIWDRGTARRRNTRTEDPR